MSIDYKKELEKASKRMILVHKPDVLIRLMIRMIIQKVRVNHCSILLHDRTKDSYVLTVSRGPSGIKVPEGFTRMDLDNPLIRFFRERENNLPLSREFLVYEEAKKLMNFIADSDPTKKLLSQVLYQMELFETTTCIPSYYREELMGILLLGDKNSGAKFDMDELSFFTALSQDVAMNIRNAQLIRELQRELDKKKSLFISTTVAMAAAIEAKDNYTHGHTSRVTTYALEMARKLVQKNEKTTNDNFYEDIHIASLLHDIGKIGVPESILNKEGPLNEEERKKINEHPMIGVKILHSIQELETVILGVKYHHERFDGKGYPEGLKGDEIPLIAAIIAVADSFDAMTSDRPYRKGFAREKAIEIIKQESGKQFNPYIVGLFLEAIAENKI